MTSPLTFPLTRPLTYPLTAPLGTVMGQGGGRILDKVPGAAAAWSSASKLVNSFAGTPMASSAGTVTTFSDQIGANTLTASGSPALNTDGINNLQYCSLDGVDDTLALATAIALTGDFTLLMAVGFADETTNQAFIGKNTTSSPYIRYGSSTTILFRNDAATSVTLTLTGSRKITRAFGVWMFKRTGSTIEAFLNGESLGTVTISGTITFDRISKNQNAQWIKGGFGGAAVWQRATTTAEDAIIIADWMPKWASTVYYDAQNGNDNNAGWNAQVPLKTLADARARVWRPNSYNVSAVLSGIFRHDPLFIAQAGTSATAQYDSVVFKADPVNGAWIFGSTNVALAAATLVTGTEYKIAYTAAPPFAAYYIDGNTAADILNDAKITRLVFGTAGALAVGECAFDGTFFYLNIGKSPTGGQAEIPAGTGVDLDDSGVRISKAGFTTDGINACFCVNDGFRPSGSYLTHKNGKARWNNGDSVGPTSITVGQLRVIDFFAIGPGVGLAISGSAGDNYSCHGSLVLYLRCISVQADKAGFDNVLGSTTQIIDCESRYDNQGYWNANLGGVANNETISNLKITRRAGNTSKMFNLESQNADVVVVNGLTLIDEEASAGTYGIVSNLGSNTSLTYSNVSYTGITLAKQLVWNGNGALVAA